MATLNSYFVRHLGLANSIMGCGVSLGGLILAPLFTHLFREYGYRGAFLIAAGLYFNILVFGLLFRPVEFYTKKKEKGNTGENIEFERETVINCNRNTEANIEQFERPVNINANDRHADELETESFLEKGGTIVFRDREQKALEREHPARDEAEGRLFETNTMKHVSVDLHTSLHSLYNTVKDLQDERQITHEDAIQRKSRIPRNVKNLVRTIFDFAILKESLFLYYLLCTVFLCSGNASTPFYVAPLANEIGMDEDETAFVLMVVNVVDLFARIAIGFVSDRNWLRRSNMVALASCVLGVTCCFVHFVNCFVSLVIFAIVVGLLQGVYWSLFAVVIVDYLTLEKLKSALGFCGLVQGLSIGCAIPIAGK